jgi:Fe-S-cluster containining protein
VRLGPGEAERIAAFLRLSVEAFTRDYARLTGDRRGLSLTEKENGECSFLSPEGRCLIQAVKPTQCRDFPHKWSFEGYERVCRATQERELK